MRFYFDIEDGQRARDEDGIDLADVAAARLHAVEILINVVRIATRGEDYKSIALIKDETKAPVAKAVMSVKFEPVD